MTTTETKTDLTFAQLRAANLKRCPLFRNAKGELCHPTGVMDWTPDQWMTALVGEVGEAANDIKKVNRGDLSLAEALPKIGSEIADAQTYLDLLTARLGLSLAEITIAKFNEVSQKVGCDIFLGEAPPGPAAELLLTIEIANAESRRVALSDERPVIAREIRDTGLWVAETRVNASTIGSRAWGATKLAALQALHRLVGAAPVTTSTPEPRSACCVTPAEPDELRALFDRVERARIVYSVAAPKRERMSNAITDANRNLLAYLRPRVDSTGMATITNELLPSLHEACVAYVNADNKSEAEAALTKIERIRADICALVRAEVAALPSAPMPTPQVARRDLFHCPQCGKHGHQRQGAPGWRCHGCEISWDLLPIQEPVAKPSGPRRRAAGQCAALATRLNRIRRAARDYGAGSEFDTALDGLAAFLNGNYQPTGDR
jgi:NTP pyrophosphatase (non-canonical NTP hydrolase)